MGATTQSNESDYLGARGRHVETPLVPLDTDATVRFVPDLLDSVNVLIEPTLNSMMHSKTQTMNRETLNALHHLTVQLESGPVKDNDPGAGGRSNINGIGREMDRDSLRADCIMTTKKLLEVANATGSPETVRNIWGRTDSESELEDLDDPSGDSADEEIHEDVDDNNSGPLGTSFTINGLEPGFNDTTPCELLHDVIKLYQADLLARPDTALERKEYFLRRLIKHAEEWNQNYSPQHDLQPMTRQLVNIMLDQGKSAEADSITTGKSPSIAPPVLPTGHALQNSQDPRTRIEESEWYYLWTQYQFEAYDLARNQDFLDDAEKLAKRCFNIRYELRHHYGTNTKFRESQKLLVEILSRQQHSPEAKVYRDLCQEPSTVPLDSSQFHLPPRSARSSLSNASLPTQPARPIRWCSFPRDINQRSESDGSTYLIRAVKRGHEVEVEELIRREGADVNHTDKEGKTPLLHAVIEGDGGMVDVLTNCGAKLDATHNSRTIMQEAIERDSASIVLQLRKLGAKLDEPTMNGMRPLLYIIQGNPRVSTKVLKAFCCRGEDDAALPQPEMDGIDEMGLTAVHYAVRRDNEEVIEILLSNGADPNIGCKVGKTPLHFAVTERKEIALKKLLQHCNDGNKGSCVDVNAEDKLHRTPLVFSVRDKGGNKFARLLLEAGADVHKCMPLIHDWNSLSPPMMKILKQYQRNPTDSASIISSTASISTTNSRPSIAATIKTSSYLRRLSLKRRDT